MSADFGAFVPGAHHIELSSGGYLDLAAPDAAVITIGDDRVKAADDWALSAEAFYLLPSRGQTWFCAGVFQPEHDALHSWEQRPRGLTPDEARRQWLDAHDFWTREAARG